MDTDLILVSGIVLTALSIPSIMAVISDGRVPRFSLLILLCALGLIGWAVFSRPGGYSLDDVMNAFVNVAAMVTG